MKEKATVRANGPSRPKKSANSRTRSRRCAGNWPNSASANSRSACALAPVGLEFRLSEEEALEIVDAHALQQLRVGFGFDPLSHGQQIEALCQTDQRAHEEIGRASWRDRG